MREALHGGVERTAPGRCGRHGGVERRRDHDADQQRRDQRREGRLFAYIFFIPDGQAAPARPGRRGRASNAETVMAPTNGGAISGGNGGSNSTG